VSADRPAPDHPIVRARWIILLLFAAVTAWLVPGVAHIQNDDDVLAFLPPDHEDVQTFNRVAERFGMLEVALVGLAPETGDVLAPERVDEVRALAKRVSELEGVKLVLSFADLPNPQVTEEGMIVAELVPADLRDPEEIRRRVLSNRNAVGNVVSESGDAAALLVFLLPKGDTGADAFAKRRDTLAGIRDSVADGWSGEAHFAGAPFVEIAASNASRTDIEDLSPIVIVVLAAASALLLRSVTAAFLNLLLAGAGVGWIMGAHGRFDEALTIVSSSTPVMMVALGGAFGVHILAGYQRHSGTSRARASAVVRELWLPVLLSGCTTAVAFFALMAMPQVPMQRFGVAAGIGMLLLLVLALLVLPALLAVLPNGLLSSRDDLRLWLPPRPPAVLVGLLAIAGVGLGLRMTADPDTSNVFEADTEPRRADAFFQEHFGGSTFLQVTIDGVGDDGLALLQEAEVLRRIRDMGEEIAVIEGVVDVRSVVEPAVIITEALGGRRGVPESTARARRVMTYLIGHPAMAQLMTEDANGALIHVKLAPMPGAEQVRLTREVREVLSRHGLDGLRVAKASDPEVAAIRTQDVERRVNRLLGRGEGDRISLADADAGGGGASPEVLEKIATLRDNLFDEDNEDNIFETSKLEVTPEEISGLDPKSVVELRGAELEKVMKAAWPTVAEKDPEGIQFAAEHLGSWVDDLIKKAGAGDRCSALGLDEEQCELVRPALSELDDEEWAVPTDMEADAFRDLEFHVHLTGQPVIGQAFAESVTRSLGTSTAVSVVALALVLLVSRFVRALAPALWTLAVTAGVISVLGHPISVGTSMVSCIALGAGVDFAIHLSFRVRQLSGPDAPQRAVSALGPVVLISAIQLGLAFLVLRASSMRPLQDFGTGLAVGLCVAALGAVWLTPLLYRGPKVVVKDAKLDE
jgi:predicted RND superfamily exporter protein